LGHRQQPRWVVIADEVSSELRNAMFVAVRGTSMQQYVGVDW
jgi:hypothetical protein